MFLVFLTRSYGGGSFLSPLNPLSFLFSIFAPDVTGSSGAHQPMARDEYSALYNNYQVLSNSFRIDASVSGSVSCIVGYSIRRDSVTAVGPRYIEQAPTKYKVFSFDDANRATQTLTGSANIANELGLSPTNDELETTQGSDPNETLYLHIFAFALNPTQDPNEIRVAITMDYMTKFREKKLLTQS